MGPAQEPAYNRVGCGFALALTHVASVVVHSVKLLLVRLALSNGSRPSTLAEWDARSIDGRR
jgi:hypothetical protein